MNNPTTDEQTFEQELSAVVVWLTLHPADWCVFGLSADRLDVAVDAATLAPIMADLADEGMRVQVDEHAHVAQVDGHRLRVRLCYGPQFRTLARSAIHASILGRALPVAAARCSSADALAA